MTSDFGAVASPGAGDWQRAFQALQQQIAAARCCEFPVFTRLVEHPPLGRDLSYYRRTDTTTFESWYPAGCAGGSEKATSFTLSANTLYLTPHVFTAGYRIAQLGLDTVTGAGNSRIGVWESADDGNGNPLPTRLIYDSGSIDTSTAATDKVDPDIDVEPGRLYWFGVESDNTPTLRALGRRSIVPVLGWPTGLGADPNFGYTVAHTFGALPDPFTTTATAFSTTCLPAVFMRLSNGGLYEHARVIPAWAPPEAGYVLRRAKLLWSGDEYPRQEASFLTLRVGIRRGTNFSEVGSFDTRQMGVVEAGSAYPLTGDGDVDAALAADQTLEVRLVQSGYPRIQVADSVVQWDVAHVGTG